MNELTVKEYLKIAIGLRYPLKLNWVISMFSILNENSKYVKIDGDDLLVNIGDKWLYLTDCKKGSAIINPLNEIEVDNTYLSNIDEPIVTTMGRLLLNYVLITNNFGNKVKYINKKFDVGYVENAIIAPLLKDDSEAKGDFISVSEYINFVDSAIYLQNWSDVISVSATRKSLIAPDGIKEYRKKLLEEAVKEHGPDALKDYTIIADIEAKLKDYDKEFLKDDPSLGKLMGGKMLNNSRKKIFLMGGAEKNFGAADDDALLIEDTLEDGLESDPEKLASHFNSIRFASYSRGSETFKGGLTAKILLRATSAIVITGEDCKTKGFKQWNVTSNNFESLVGRYVINGNSVTLIDTVSDAKVYIGKQVKLRSPQYCIAKGENICKVCAGKGLSANENSVPLIVTSIGATILALSMKAMHKTIVETVPLDMSDMLT